MTEYLDGTDFSKARTQQIYGAADMYMNQYQLKARETAKYENDLYPLMSLMVESAELADLFIKPKLRGDPYQPSREEVISEAGDVLWNLTNFLEDQDILMSEVAIYNICKVVSRAERGVIQGSGGSR